MNFDRTVDTLIVGTGNGALTTAVCLHQMGVTDLLVIEKSDKIGGSLTSIFCCNIAPTGDI